MTPEEILHDLDEVKQAAIKRVSGPTVVLAGAGTGKTLTLVRKIAYLVSQGMAQDEILALTFSNEATKHLQTKLDELETRDVPVRTFHGFCSDILREQGHLIDVPSDFKILMPNEIKVLLFQEHGLSSYDADQFALSITTAKDLDVSREVIVEYVDGLKAALGDNPKEHALEARRELQTLYMDANARSRKKELMVFLKPFGEYEKLARFLESWVWYEGFKKEHSLLDFSDLNLLVLRLFAEHGAEEYQNQFKHVLVDEFQDTNKQQFELIRILASHKNITVVGDLNQAIYGFRGAYKEGFKHFKEEFGVEKIFRLERSRRSPNAVLEAAYNVIKNNYEDEKDCIKVLSAFDKAGAPVNVLAFETGDDEAFRVAEMVEEALDKGTPRDEICVLYRTHQQGVRFQQALAGRKIPFVTSSVGNLMRTVEIRTTIAHLGVVANLRAQTGLGDQSWWSLFHYNHALSPADTLSIGRYVKRHKHPIDEALLHHRDEIELSTEGEHIIDRVLERLQIVAKEQQLPLPELVMRVYEISGLNRAFSADRTISDLESLMNLRAFYEFVEQYASLFGNDLTQFMTYLESYEQLGLSKEESRVVNVDAVRLMTVHAAKGLEFSHVFVTNLAKDRFPIRRTRKEPLIPKHMNPDIARELERRGTDDEAVIKEYEAATLLAEERRLCYVAMTRAKEELVLTYARQYATQDQREPSIFLQESGLTIEDVPAQNSVLLAPSSHRDRILASLKRQLLQSLDSEGFEALRDRLRLYEVVKSGDIDCCGDLGGMREQAEALLADATDEEVRLRFHKEVMLSVSALTTYAECPKKYELRNLLRMPEAGAYQYNAMTQGSYVHKVLEEGVKRGVTSEEGFQAIARELAPEFEADADSVREMISLFFARNKGLYSEASETEKKFTFELDGKNYIGYIDRVDHYDGKVRVIDYKTGKAPDKKKREWQLGLYAYALGLEGAEVQELIIDSFQHEKIIKYEKKNGQFIATIGGRGYFKVNEIVETMKETARQLEHDYEHGFEPAEEDSPCFYCKYKFYCPKWSEKE